MNPVFFGARDRRLFGMYTPGHSPGIKPRAVVVCYPWGQEYLRSHRAVKHLATLLARAGVHVLRFDYHGTGDSAGEMDENRLADWESDIETAIEELKDTASVSEVGLVGLRLGGAMAARVAARRRDVDRLALWDPIVLGDEYPSDLDRLVAEAPIFGARRAANAAAAAKDILGFPLGVELARDIRAIDLLSLLPALPTRTMILVSQLLPSHGPLRAQHAVDEDACSPAWLEDADSGVGAIPVVLLQRLTGWLG